MVSKPVLELLIRFLFAVPYVDAIHGSVGLIDENPNCATNQWVADGNQFEHFAVANQGCIP